MRHYPHESLKRPICLVLTALLAYLNHRFIGLPTTIGVMVAALGLSLALVALDGLGLAGGLLGYEVSFLRSIDFSDVLMEGMLSLLLFAGALHVDLSELRAYRWQIGLLAVSGTTLSTALVGGVMWWLLPMLGLPLELPWCLLFGALLSPTDPIAVIGILRGGISVALALSLPIAPQRDTLLALTYCVVVFSILVQGLSIGKLVRRVVPAEKRPSR